MSDPTEPNYHGVTMKHVANLRNHAAFVSEQPSIRMKYFATDVDGLDILPVKVHECGSAMCAIGLVPFNKSMNIGNISGSTRWEDVSKSAFGFFEDSYSGLLRKFWKGAFGSKVLDSPAVVSASMEYVADQLEALILSENSEAA